MFMITLGKKSVRGLCVAALCGVACCAWLFGSEYYQTTAVAASTVTKIKTTQDIQTYFTGFGLEVDPADITADKVKVPRSWDDSFSAFNMLVAQSGQDLTKYKGKTVEKWLALIPANSTGNSTQYGVLLVYKEKVVGSYLLEKPSGKVTGLTDAVAAQAELRTNSGTASLEEGAGGSTGEENAASEASADAMPEQPVSLDTPIVFDADGYPVE